MWWRESEKVGAGNQTLLSTPRTLGVALASILTKYNRQVTHFVRNILELWKMCLNIQVIFDHINSRRDKHIIEVKPIMSILCVAEMMIIENIVLFNYVTNITHVIKNLL